MKWISTTIKKKYMDQILSGEKKVEYKIAIDYWKKRIDNVIYSFPPDGGFPENAGINFLCGRKSYKYKIRFITLTIGEITIDDKKGNAFYEIHLGERIEALRHTK